MEDLSNEVIYEIFEYLDYFHICEAFFNVNTRFRRLLTDSNLPIKMDLSSLSRSTWKRYNEYLIETNISRICALRVSDRFMYDVVRPSLEKIIQFGRVETLILDNIESECLEDLLNDLPSLSQLSSLVINAVDHVTNKAMIYRQICRLPMLRYCKLSWPEWRMSEWLPICTDEYSPIEHLIITNCICICHLDSLLSYVPQLHRL